jgi:hypothetical protein
MDEQIWPSHREIGRFVTTAGRVSIDDAASRTHLVRELPTPFLPAGFKIQLKDIDGDSMGWFYHDRYGVLHLPIELFLPK